MVYHHHDLLGGYLQHALFSDLVLLGGSVDVLRSGLKLGQVLIDRHVEIDPVHLVALPSLMSILARGA